MSPSDHDRDQTSRHGGGESSRRGQKGQERSDKRRAKPVALGETPPTLLSPLYSHLPALNTLKSYLPASPKKTPPPPSAAGEPRWAMWQHADLDDGHGKRYAFGFRRAECRPVLLTSSKAVALQIWTVSSSRLPDDPHVQEEYPPPEQVWSLARIVVDDKGWEAQVLAAQIMPRATWNGEGPLVAAVLAIPAPNPKRGAFILSIALVSLRTSKTIKTAELGQATGASLEVSDRAIAIATSHPSPSIHLRHPNTLESLLPPLIDLPASPHSSIPVCALSGRLLAYATSQPPGRPGPDGLGSLITAETIARQRPQKADPSAAGTGRRSDASSALLNTAVNVGGAAARGIWAGVKMGVNAAGKARESRLARSAPSGGVLADEAEIEGQESPSAARSMEDSSILDSLSLDSSGAAHGGVWIKVIDVARRAGGEARLIAHFRLPPSRAILPPLDSLSPQPATQPAPAQAISHLSFSPDGTKLLVAPADAKSLHIVELHPAGVRAVRGECKGEVWHTYELRRGNTSAKVGDVAWDPAGRWVSVSTSHGTAHVFPVHPSGSTAASASHATNRPFNPPSLPSLSAVVYPVARFRSFLAEHSKPDGAVVREEDPAIVAFDSLRPIPLAKGSFAQDLLVARGGGQIVELARITTRARTAPAGWTERRGSGIAQMIRLGSNPSDWTAEDAVKARWSMSIDGATEDFLLAATTSASHTLPRSSLSQIEIQTHSNNPRILPASIYLSKQVDFFGAKAIDEYTPQSIMDIEARTRRLHYRDEVEAKSLPPLATSPFDEPLLSALHSVIESAPESQIPGLPNGPPPKWRSPIPIRHVASGLHEGVGLLQREYAKAQRRRTSAAAVNKLSFEEDTVFPSSDEAPSDGSGPGLGLGLEGESSPASEALPTTEVGDDEEWGEGWEEEYRKAVEDDGGPDDLVLGLLDEEQEERRKWEIRQKKLAKQYQTQS